jgi:hypothetical protein
MVIRIHLINNHGLNEPLLDQILSNSKQNIKEGRVERIKHLNYQQQGLAWLHPDMIV